MNTHAALSLRFCFAAIAIASPLLGSCRKHETNTRAPTAAVSPPVSSDNIQWTRAVPPPPLGGQGAKARAAADSFVRWAMSSTSAQKPLARSALSRVRTNEDVAQAFFEQAKQFRHSDPSRSLIALALLGEMKSPRGFELLTSFLALPRAKIARHAVQGTARTFVGTHARWDEQLAAKAIDGIAYLVAPEANASVLATVRSGDTQYLRTAAADAYIWNQHDSEKARSQIEAVARPAERWIRDRFRRYDEDTPQSLDGKIQAWIRKYPNFLPPKPKNSTGEQPRLHDTTPKISIHSDVAPTVKLASGRPNALALTTYPLKSSNWIASAQRPHSHCPPASINVWDNLYYHSHNWGGQPQSQDIWRSFIADNFSIVQGDWGNDGYPDLVNPQGPYFLMANSAFLITYAMTADPGFTFHDPRLDYFELAEGHGGRFKFDSYYGISTGDGSLYADFEASHSLSPDEIMTYCGMFDPTMDPASRAAILMHEAWHGWQLRYHWDVNTASGHLPISPPGLPAVFPPGNCKWESACDYYTLHRVSLFPPGQMEYSTPNPGPNQKMHMPYQVEVEFLCDLAQRHVPSFPVPLEMAAESQADYLVANVFLNPVPLGCGSRRPF